jgi:hypothetical protein
MATTTPNFGWSVPTSSDLVKNGATAIETLGDSIDASLVDLKGGTTGQVLAKATNTDMDFTWTTASSGSSYADNAILNSSFNVWQRGTSFTIPSGVPTYFADRFQITRSATGCTATRQATSDTTNLPFIQYCARVARDSGNTSTTDIYLTHSLDTLNTIPLAGKTVVLSYYARKGANYSATSSALGIAASTGTGTDQNVNAGYTGSATVLTSSITLTTTWQRFSHTISIGATATEFGFYHTYTPTGTAGANDYFEITGYQLEIASSASAYHPNQPTYQAELAACQRYYYNHATGSTIPIGVGYNESATSMGTHVKFPVTMRVAPTLSSVTGTGYYTIYRNGTTDDFNSFTLGAVGPNEAAIYNNSEISGTAGQAGNCYTINAASFISFSAEL